MTTKKQNTPVEPKKTELEELVEVVRVKNELLRISASLEGIHQETFETTRFIKDSGEQCKNLLDENDQLELQRIQLREEKAEPAEIRTIQGQIDRNQNQIRVLVAEVADTVEVLDKLDDSLVPFGEKFDKIRYFMFESFFVEVPQPSGAGQRTQGGKLYQKYEQTVGVEDSIRKMLIESQLERDRILKNFKEKPLDLEPLKSQLAMMEKQRNELEQGLNNFSTSDDKQLVADLTEDIDRLRKRIQNRG